MLFQHPRASLDPTFRVGKHITEPLRLHLDMSRRDAKNRMLELLASVGLPDGRDWARAFPYELSGGMAQRVMTAAAIACAPDLLIADEPTTALDVTIQAHVLSLLRSLTREMDLGVLLISHDIGVVAAVADRVAVMYAGQIVEVGATADVLSQPVHPYTSALIKCSAMASESRTEGRLVVIPGSVPNLAEEFSGCRFAPRCPARIPSGIEDLCDSTPPSLDVVDSTRVARCHLVGMARAAETQTGLRD